VRPAAAHSSSWDQTMTRPVPVIPISLNVGHAGTSPSLHVGHELIHASSIVGVWPVVVGVFTATPENR
jgi:hypothetical protein